MYDPIETPVEYEHESDEKVRRLPVRGVACFLLVVMLCSVISTPLAIFLYWNNSRQERPTPTAVPFETTAENGAEGGRIAYITPRGQLATVAPDGTALQLLTDSNQTFQFPAWAPDNSRLAVIGGGQDGFGVYVISDAPGSELQALYQNSDETPIYLYWAPDSNQVSFLASHPSGLALHIGDVLADSSRLLAIGQPFYWDWTPAGDQILIHSGFAGEDSRLAIIDPDGDGTGTNISEPGFFQAPGISPNGRFWAYAQVDGDSNGQLTILDGESGQAQQTVPHLGLTAMGWNPVSDVLAYIAPTVDAPVFYGPLQLLDAATGENRIVANNLVVAFFWSPDGRYIAYFTIANLDDNTIQASLPGKTSLLSKTSSQEDEPLIMEVWLADTQDGSVRRLRAFEPTDLFVFQFLPFFDQYSRSHRIWSADSQSLVLPIVEEDVSRIYVLPVDGGEATAVADGVIGFWNQ
jgi:TolB protein